MWGFLATDIPDFYYHFTLNYFKPTDFRVIEDSLLVFMMSAKQMVEKNPEEVNIRSKTQ